MNSLLVSGFRWEIITRSTVRLALASLAVALALTQSFAASTPAFRLLRSFEGPPSDGYFPANGTSLAGTGSVLYGMTTSGGQTTNGVVFKVNSDGTGYQVLHHFNGYTSFLNPSGSRNDGAQPYGTPVLSGSTLYGTTTQGGSNGIGTVFKMNTDGTGFQILHHFNSSFSSGDGSFPNDSLVLVGSTLYGTTAGGGAVGSDGTVFKINTDGSGYQVLHSSVVTGGEGAVPHGPLLVVGSKIYGVTELGGTGGQGIAFQMNTDGTGYQIIHTFTGTSTDGAFGVGGLLQLGSSLYGMTRNGGANNFGTFYVMATNGSNFRILHNFALNDGWSPVAGLASAGMTLYGMTRNGAASGSLGSGTIFQINADGSGYQVLHTFSFPVTATDGIFPMGPPLVLGSTLYGMTQLGGGSHNGGCVFAQTLSGATTPGIVTCTLSPMSATNTVGSTHTVTATVTSNGVVKAGVPVTFRILAGPNISRTGSGVTSAKGQVSFTYTGTGGVGIDVIQALVAVPGISAGAVAAKTWVPAPPVPHDMTITKLLVTKAITLTGAKPSQVKPVKITFQNRSQHSETITDATMLSNLLTLTIESLGDCASPAKIISPRTIASLPRTLKPNQSFIAQFDVTYNCGNDPLKSSAASPGHEDFRYIARVNHSAFGNADTTPSNDVCPRSPDPATGDKGCGNIDAATRQVGAAVLTDVVVK